MSFNIWMWILLVLFIVGTIAVILILTVGSVRESAHMTVDQKMKSAKI